MEAKKISFGFSKISKKTNLLPTKENTRKETKMELIKCLEGQEIKLMEEKPEEVPLTIPLKNSQKTSTALASLMRRRAVLLGEDEQEETNSTKTVVNNTEIDKGREDIEKRAARELLAEVQKNNCSDPASTLVVTVANADELPLEGAKEPTLDDYENIPIEDFGKAMLRGMGWTEPLQKAGKKRNLPADDVPVVRPKGMGLGADKALSIKTILIAPEANEVLEIKRNAFVRILGGKYKCLYGQIEGFDEHKGRVIVKLAIGGAKESFNEFLCQPVSRKEYAQYGKCINSSKYDEYKKMENEYGQIILDRDSISPKSKKEANFKKELEDTETNSRYKHTKDEQNVKQETGRIKEEKYRKQTDYEVDIKNRKYDNSYKKNYRRNLYEERNREYDDVKYEKHYSRDNRNDYNGEDKYRNSKSCDSYKDRDGRSDHKKFQNISHGSSDSESDTYTSSKSKKHSKKKSKRSKSKHKNSSTDSESTSTDTSSEKRKQRLKKHKKKTKKSKKQREHSRERR